MCYSKSKLDEIWEKGKKIRGKNPNLYRQDPCGNVMYRPSRGKHSPMGWEADHINHLLGNQTDNLQPLNTKTNRRKGNEPLSCDRHSR